MPDTRLIERWLPIAALGVESLRERTPMTPFPAPNRLHVWWARRPLVAARAAVLASLLPADADREKFLHALGIHGDPVATRRKSPLPVGEGNALRVRLTVTLGRLDTLPIQMTRIGCERCSVIPRTSSQFSIPPLGEGVFPFEVVRFGGESIANDLNPVSR